MRVLSVLIACSALAFAGCGSSGSSSSSSTGAAPTTTSTTTATHPSTSPAASLKGATTPKYATPSRSSPVQSGVVQIAYREITMEPDTVRVKVGSTIKWTNYDSVEHNVTSKGGPISFASKNFGEGHTVEFKMTKPGIIHYECTIHPTTMNGAIEVVQ